MQIALAPLVARWQRRLRLRDWKIDAHWASEEELAAFFAEDADEKNPKQLAKLSCAATDASASEQWNPTPLETRTVRILMKRNAFDSAAEVDQAIAHEMLHVLLWPIAPQDNDALRRVLLEQIIATLEGALAGGEK